MRLTPTDDRSARISHQAEVILLRWAGDGIITLVPLKGGDHHIAIRFQLIDPLCEIREITRRCAGLKICCSWETIDIRFVTADKCDLVTIDLKQRGLQ